MKKVVIVLILITLMVGTTMLIVSMYRQDTAPVLGFGTIEAREIRVGSKLGGRVAQVHVYEGDTVMQSRVLISLDSRELEAQLLEANAAQLSAKASLEELKSGYRPELIDRARAEVREQLEQLKKLKAGPRIEEIQAQEAKMNLAQADYNYAMKTYERLVEQIKEGVVAQQEKDDARRSLETGKERFIAEKKSYELLKAGSRIEDLEIAAARLAQAQAEFKRLETGPRKEEVDRAKAFLEEADARVKRLTIQLEERQIVAPSKARVEVCDWEPGDILAPGQVALTLLKPEDMWVKFYIKEHELHKVSLNQEVKVAVELSDVRQFRSWGLRKIFSWIGDAAVIKYFPGKVVHIASEAEFTPRNVQTKEERGNQVFAIKAKITDASGFLRPGMSVTVEE